ncbi:MAG: hypothetical protein MZV64_44110 [Ignavibacteriales bacterium]|nr:hypothetical protein [Ignavibacteriales bacterium]
MLMLDLFGLNVLRMTHGTDSQPQFQIYDFAINAPGDVVAGYQKFKRENLSFNAALSAVVGESSLGKNRR